MSEQQFSPVVDADGHVLWGGMVQDPQLATAYTRAYNRWIADFCAHDHTSLNNQFLSLCIGHNHAV